MEIKTERFSEAAREGLKNAHAHGFLKLRANFVRARRETALSTFPDAAAAQAYGAAIREEAIARLPELLEEFEKNALANGARVFWARDAKEANEYIVHLAKEKGIEYVTKGKSMVTEELGLNEALEKNGVKAWETDLGEFIIQLLHLPPFHIVGPAINVPVEKVRDVFIEKINLKEPTLDPVQLGYAARLFLRDKFHRVRMGITGVNIAVAETGTLINVENEGNIRFSKSSPRTQISVMSLEKVVPTLEDALHLVRLLCRNCTGQKLSVYVSMDNSPKKGDEMDGPEELIIVIVDNCRSKIYQDKIAREAMRCIRCGACLNSCPVYREIGGYAYGWAYSGPMGQVLNPLLLGLERTQDLYRATTLCGACKGVCPAGIDHPGLFLQYRARDVLGEATFQARKRPWMERSFFRLWTWAVTRSWLWNWAVRIVRPFINKDAHEGLLGKVRGPFEGWFRNRDLPAMAEKTFHDRWRETQKTEFRSQKPQ
ncbi:MAG: lactate utilization protein B [Thermodesulfobacteriota bacterium]